MSKNDVVIPKVSTIEKMLQRLRRIQKLDGRFTDWDIETLLDYPIDPEAIPLVMDIYEYKQERNERLQIIDVQWVARLHRIYNPQCKSAMTDFLDIIRDCVSGELMRLYNKEYRPSRRNKREASTKLEIPVDVLKNTVKGRH